MRKDEERFPKIFLDIAVEGKRRVGRPCKSRMDGVRKNLQQLEAWPNWETTAEDRRERKPLILSSMSDLVK